MTAISDPGATRFVLVTGHTFGRRALDGLLASDAALDGRLVCRLVVGLDEKKRDVTSGFTPVSEAAREWSVPFLSTDDGSLLSAVVNIATTRPHFILVIGWSRLVNPLVLDIPAGVCRSNQRNAPDHGCIGMHPTRLPQGRGQAPIPWTILNGLEQTALTTLFLEESVYSGQIISQDEVKVRPAETSATLFARFAELHYRAGARLAGMLAARHVPGNAQDHRLATLWPRRRPADGRINPASPSVEIDRLVRALCGPYPRAFVTVGGLAVRVTQARLVSPGEGVPGVVETVQAKWLRLGCADGIVDLTVDDRDVSMLPLLRPGMRVTAPERPT